MRGPVVPLLLSLAAVAALVLAYAWWPETPDATPLPAQRGGTSAEPTNSSTDDPARSREIVDARPVIPAGRGLVRVIAQSEDGQPLPDSLVTFGDGQPVATDVQGRVEFEAVPDRYVLEVQPRDPSARYPVRQRVSAEAGELTEVVVRLALRGTPAFWCRVTAEDTGGAIPGAQLAIRPYGGVDIAADANGLAEVGPGADGDWYRISAPGRSPRRVVPQPGHGTAATALEVPLLPEAVLHLSVTDERDAPVSDADVTVTAMAWSLHWPMSAAPPGGPEIWTARLDEEGACSISGLPPSAPLYLRVTSFSDSVAPTSQSLELRPGINQHRLQLLATGALRGRVRDAGGHGLPRARVMAIQVTPETDLPLLPTDARGESTLTSDDGSFELAPLAPGAWLVGLVDTDGWTAYPRKFVVPAGGSVNAEIAALPALTISGRLDSPRGPIDMFEIYAVRDGLIVAADSTEKDGGFELGPLPPGDYDVVTELYEGGLALPVPLRVSAGRTNVDVRVESVLGDLRGRVSTPIVGNAWFRGLRRGGIEYCSGRCDLDGQFAGTGLREGVWDLTVQDETGRIGLREGIEIEVGAETEDIVVALEPGALILAAHPDASSFTVERGDVVVVRGALELGIPAPALVPAGVWTVVFRRGSFELGRRQVTAVAGRRNLVDASRPN